MPPDGRRKKQWLAGGSTIGQLCFTHLKFCRSEAHEPQYNRGCTDDSPLHDRHVLDAVNNAADKFGKVFRDKMHDLSFGYDRFELRRELAIRSSKKPWVSRYPTGKARLFELAMQTKLHAVPTKPRLA